MGEDRLQISRWMIALPISGLIAIGFSAFTYFNEQKQSQAQTDPAAETVARVTKVIALGRLEPQGEVIEVSTSQRAARINRVLVAEADRVKAGEVIAILENFASLQAVVKTAEEEVAVARSRLAKVTVGGQLGEINAQKATIERLKAELAGESATQSATLQRLKAQLRNAEAEFQRYQFLEAEGAISQSDLDQRQLDLDTAREAYLEAMTRRDKTINTLQEEIREAQATLEKIQEVRPVDVQEANAELQSAIARLEQAKAELELSKVTAPISGQVIAINTHAGEIVNEEEGIIELGNTETMVAIAEVYESDIKRVKLGQAATITSENDSFNQEITGQVSRIGLKIGRKEVFTTDPAANVDARVIEVEIALTPESSKIVKGLTNAQVLVKIDSENN